MSFTLKNKCIDACIIRGDYEYKFWDACLDDYDPMRTTIERRPAYTNAKWEELGPMDLPMTRFMLTGYIKFDMRAGMTFQEFVASAFPDTEQELK